MGSSEVFEKSMVVMPEKDEEDLENGTDSLDDKIRRKRASIQRRKQAFKEHLEEEKNMTWTRRALERMKVLLPVIGIFVLTILAMTYFLKDQVFAAFEWMQNEQPLSVILYIGVMAVWVTAFLSKSILSTAGGFVFGFWIGCLGAIAGMFLGMLLTIGLVRTLFTWCGWREKMRGWLLKKYIEVRLFNDLVVTEPYRAIFLIKMSLLPTWLKTYALAILDAPDIPHLIVGSVSASIYSVLFVYLGSAAKSLLDAIEGGKGVDLKTILINVFGIVMSILVLVYIRYKFKKAMKEAEEQLEQNEEDELHELEKLAAFQHEQQESSENP